MITDIFLFAQNKQLNKLDSILKTNNLELFKKELIIILKDTVNFNENEKISFSLLKAKYYLKKGNAGIALNYLKKNENYFEQKKDSIMLAEINYEIFSLLLSQQNLDKLNEANIYLDKYLDFAKKTNDKEKLLKAYMGYAGLAIKTKKTNKALVFYNKSKNIAVLNKDSLTLAKIYNNKGIIFKNFYNRLDSARFFYKKALVIYSKINKTQKVFNTIVNISSSYKSEKNYTEAIKWLKKADSIPISSYKINSKKFLYKLLSKNYEQLADYKNANLYLNKYIAYKDSVDIKEQNIAISDIQTKYETEKKENNIIKLKAEKDKQKNYMIIGTGSFIFIILIAILANYNLKRKRNLAEKNRQIEHQKVVSLMKEQELKTLDAIVEGQEKERKRIAEDLHDNLGSKLAVLKLQFDSFMENETAKKNKQLFKELQSTSNLLEDTYQTVRSMSHVESNREIQQSLVHSVKVLAANISNSNQLSIEVIDFGLEQSINHKIEITVLRIIQELITNIIKYAKANKVTIDLTLFDNTLGIIVSDDGIGFNSKKLKTKGLGLKSITKRVLKLNGTINIDSGLGNGTTIIIELPIKQNNI